MSDKEERILIIKITSDPYTCDIGGICKDKVCLTTLCEMGITRQEVIGKIETRLKVFLDNLQKNKDKVMPWYTTRDIAEVALKALLEGRE